MKNSRIRLTEFYGRVKVVSRSEKWLRVATHPCKVVHCHGRCGTKRHACISRILVPLCLTNLLLHQFGHAVTPVQKAPTRSHAPSFCKASFDGWWRAFRPPFVVVVVVFVRQSKRKSNPATGLMLLMFFTSLSLCWLSGQHWQIASQELSLHFHGVE